MSFKPSKKSLLKRSGTPSASNGKASKADADSSTLVSPTLPPAGGTRKSFFSFGNSSKRSCSRSADTQEQFPKSSHSPPLSINGSKKGSGGHSPVSAPQLPTRQLRSSILFRQQFDLNKLAGTEDSVCRDPSRVPVPSDRVSRPERPTTRPSSWMMMNDGTFAPPLKAQASSRSYDANQRSPESFYSETRLPTRTDQFDNSEPNVYASVATSNSQVGHQGSRPGKSTEHSAGSQVPLPQPTWESCPPPASLVSPLPPRSAASREPSASGAASKPVSLAPSPSSRPALFVLPASHSSSTYSPLAAFLGQAKPPASAGSTLSPAPLPAPSAERPSGLLAAFFDSKPTPQEPRQSKEVLAVARTSSADSQTLDSLPPSPPRGRPVEERSLGCATPLAHGSKQSADAAIDRPIADNLAVQVTTPAAPSGLAASVSPDRASNPSAHHLLDSSEPSSLKIADSASQRCPAEIGGSLGKTEEKISESSLSSRASCSAASSHYSECSELDPDGPRQRRLNSSLSSPCTNPSSTLSPLCSPQKDWQEPKTRFPYEVAEETEEEVEEASEEVTKGEEMAGMKGEAKQEAAVVNGVMVDHEKPKGKDETLDDKEELLDDKEAMLDDKEAMLDDKEEIHHDQGAMQDGEEIQCDKEVVDEGMEEVKEELEKRKISLEELLLSDLEIFHRVMSPLDYLDFFSLSQISPEFKQALEDDPRLTDAVLARYLSGFGYRSLSRRRQAGLRQKQLPKITHNDLASFYAGLEFDSIELIEYSKQALNRAGLDYRTAKMIRSSTRAHNKIVAYIRAVEELEPLPLARKNTCRRHEGRLVEPLYRPGRAAMFKVWVPCVDHWMNNEELVECERELWRSEIWSFLRKGDVCWNLAIGDFANEGRTVFDGKFLRDLSFEYDDVGHLPSWLNMLEFPPSYYHKIISSSTSTPIFYLDLSSYREEVKRTMELSEDKVEVASPQARYRVQRWVYRSLIRIPKGEWAGEIVIEVEGTSEHAKDLLRRCGGGAGTGRMDPSRKSTPWRIMREKSRPGRLWIRPVYEDERIC